MIGTHRYASDAPQDFASFQCKTQAVSVAHVEVELRSCNHGFSRLPLEYCSLGIDSAKDSESSIAILLTASPASMRFVSNQ
jgi:hypothetical protein